MRRHLIETGAIDNLAIAAGRKKGEFRGPFWSDSDVLRTRWVLQNDRELAAKADDVIALMAAAQQPDGYLHTYFNSWIRRESGRTLRLGMRIMWPGICWKRLSRISRLRESEYCSTSRSRTPTVS